VGHFFGRRLHHDLPAKLAQLGDATIIITYAERLPGGRGYVVRFVPFDGTLDGDSAARRSHQSRHGTPDRRCPAQYSGATTATRCRTAWKRQRGPSEGSRMKLLLGLMWLLHWLPLPLLGRFGEAVGSLLFMVLRRAAISR
jgi:lauroyl/myristoyl acyltransferase